MAKQLKLTGHMYSRLKIGRDLTKKKSKERNFSKERSIISYVLSSLHPNSKMFFLDQIKLITYQTPRYAWIKRGQAVISYDWPERLLYTVNVIASLEQIEALVITKGEIKSEDTVHFVQGFLKSNEKEGRSVVILLDQASWHRSDLVNNSSIHQYLLLNIPGRYDLNFVESVFSYIRNHWRRRRAGLESDTEIFNEIVEIYRNANTEKRFTNWRRGYFKVLLHILLAWIE